MNEFEQINHIVDVSIRNSSYISVLISSGVFIFYTFINKIVEYYKGKNEHKPMLEMAKAVQDMGSNIARLNTGLDRFFQDTNKKEIVRCKAAIDLSFIAFCNSIEHLCRDIIIHNDVDNNKDLIISNISQTVSAEYYKIQSNLSLYEIDGTPVSNYLKEEWIDKIIQKLITIIYNKQEKHSRISQVTSTLRAVSNDYSIYVNNKAFN